MEGEKLLEKKDNNEPDWKIVIRLKYENTTLVLGCKVLRARYDDLLEHAMKCFPIPKVYKNALYLTDENDYVVDRDVFESYLIFFPKPLIKFVVCIDEKKAIIPSRERNNKFTSDGSCKFSTIEVEHENDNNKDSKDAKKEE